MQLEYNICTVNYMSRVEYETISVESMYTLHYMTRPEYKISGLVRFGSLLIDEEDECNGILCRLKNSNGVHCPQDENLDEILAEIINRVSRITDNRDKWNILKVQLIGLHGLMEDGLLSPMLNLLFLEMSFNQLTSNRKKYPSLKVGDIWNLQYKIKISKHNWSCIVLKVGASENGVIEAVEVGL